MTHRPDVVLLYEKQKEQETSASNIEKQHPLGKLTAKEGLDLLLDPGSFFESDSFMAAAPLRFGKGSRVVRFHISLA